MAAASSSAGSTNQQSHNDTIHGNTGPIHSFDTRPTFVSDTNDNEVPVRGSQVPCSVPQLFPSAPNAMFGRDAEKEKIIDLLLESPKPRVAIMGPGGIGKTTMALSALHAEQIAGRFEHRYFLGCDSIAPSAMLWSGLADVLNIPPAGRSKDLQKIVLQHLDKPSSLICLDNFETSCLEASARSQVTEFLAHLDSLENLAILVTMRGTERPDGIQWSTPLLSPLSPVDREATHRILQDLVSDSLSSNDEHVANLVHAVGGMPLAARLVGALLRDGLETPRSLWDRWGREKTTVIQTGSNDRLSSVDVSIQVSLDCQYMKECPDAHQLLRALASLPDGFSNSEDMKDLLSRYLPSRFAFSRALHTLRKVALVYVDQHSRIRILPPIRHFCLSRMVISPTLDKAFTNLYVNFINDPSLHAIVPPELSNIYSCLKVAVPREKTGDVIRAAILYTDCCRFLGSFVDEIISLAILHSPKQTLRGDCYRMLALLQYQQDALADAEVSIIKALDLHKWRLPILKVFKPRKWARSVYSTAHNLQLLGQLHMRRDELDKAEVSFTRAIKLHQQVQDVPGEADDFMLFGSLQLNRGQLEEAEKSLNRAQKLHQQAQEPGGEVSDLYLLSVLQSRRDEPGKAEASLCRAIMFHRQAHDVLAEAEALQFLGNVQMRGDKFDEAESSFTRAVQLHQQLRDVLGEAVDLQHLGQAQMRRGKLNKAEASYTRAAQLHQQAGNVRGEADDFWDLGMLHVRGHELYQQALEHAQDVLGEADDRLDIIKQQMRRELDKAELSLTRAAQLHQQGQDVLGETRDLRDLGEIYIQTRRLEQAESSLCRALELDEKHSTPDRADTLHWMAKLRLEKGRLDEAKSLITDAIDIHKRTPDSYFDVRDAALLKEIRQRRRQALKSS